MSRFVDSGLKGAKAESFYACIYVLYLMSAIPGFIPVNEISLLVSKRLCSVFLLSLSFTDNGIPDKISTKVVSNYKDAKVKGDGVKCLSSWKRFMIADKLSGNSLGFLKQERPPCVKVLDLDPKQPGVDGRAICGRRGLTTVLPQAQATPTPTPTPPPPPPTRRTKAILTRGQ